jgi:chromatin remodeling complex protein RSC6
MVRASKNSVVEKNEVAPVSVPSTSTEVKQETTTKSSRAKKLKAEKQEVQAVVNDPSPAPAVSENVLETLPEQQTIPIDSASLSFKMSEFNAKLQQLVGLFSTVKNDYKTLEKHVLREMKIAQKASSKKRRVNVNRKPSGFIKPTRISDELAVFLGKNIGTEMARTEVSREINAYIQLNKLQDKSNGRKINPDSKLTTLLKLSQEDELTYFNLQRYMKHHFVKQVPEGVSVEMSA